MTGVRTIGLLAYLKPLISITAAGMWDVQESVWSQQSGDTLIDLWRSKCWRGGVLLLHPPWSSCLWDPLAATSHNFRARLLDSNLGWLWYILLKSVLMWSHKHYRIIMIIRSHTPWLWDFSGFIPVWTTAWKTIPSWPQNFQWWKNLP